MKKSDRFTVIILALAVLALCGCETHVNDSWDENDEIVTEFEGLRYPDVIPGYKYGVVLKTGGDAYEDAYCVNKDDNPDAFELYKADCIEAGFKELRSTAAEENTFVTLQKDEVILHIFDMPAFGEMDIIVSPLSRYCDGDCTSSRTSSDDSMTLTMIGQSCGKYAMCFMYRLADGRFIIYDGGYYDSTAADCIYNEMVRQTPQGEELEIAAWILTHSHDDHCGAYQTFAKKYYKEVKLDMTLYNFGLGEQYMEADQGYGWHKKVVEIAESKLYKEHRAITPHVGDRFDFGGLTIDVLYSCEQLLNHPFPHYNAASLVTKVSCEGQSAIFTGDTNNYSNVILSGIYTGQTLKSDILQVAHHGYWTNADIQGLYEIIDPEFVLWPVSETVFADSRLQELPANRYLLDNIAEDKLWVCFDKVIRFELPMKAGVYEIIDEDAEAIRPAA